MEVGAYARSERQSLKPLLGEVAILCIHAPGANDLLRTCKAELSYPYPYMERSTNVTRCSNLAISYAKMVLTHQLRKQN